MSEAQKLGFIFEDKIHDKLKCKFYADIFREKEIVQIYGTEYYGIDHLIYIDNYMITIQDKWEISSPDISQISQFISVTDKLQKCTGRNLLCALFVTKIKMTRNGCAFLENANNNSFRK
jgi:hypothetical protein